MDRGQIEPGVEVSLVKWATEDGQPPVYSWKKASSKNRGARNRFYVCYKHTFRNEQTQTDSDYFILEDRGKRPDIIDPFALAPVKVSKENSASIPVRIVGYDVEKHVFTVILSDIAEEKVMSANCLMRLSPTLVADFLIDRNKKAMSIPTAPDSV